MASASKTGRKNEQEFNTGHKMSAIVRHTGFNRLSLYRLAAAEQASRAREEADLQDRANRSRAQATSVVGMIAKRRKHGHEFTGSGPTSLFILSEKNIIRRTTKFLIEWPYPNSHEHTLLVFKDN